MVLLKGGARWVIWHWTLNSFTIHEFKTVYAAECTKNELAFLYLHVVLCGVAVFVSELLGTR